MKWKAISKISCMFGILIAWAVMAGIEQAQPPWGQPATQATLTLSPNTGSFNVGDTFDVDILVNTNGENVLVAAGYIKYDPASFKVNTIDTTGSVFTSGVENTIDSANGLIRISMSAPTPGVNTASGKVATINWTVLSPVNPTADNVIFDFTPGSTNRSYVGKDDEFGTGILTGVNNARFTVNSGNTALGDNSCCGYSDPSNPYPCGYCGGYDGNCTWWASYKRPDLPNQTWGDAWQWLGRAQEAGFPTGSTPEVGAIVVYPQYWCGSTDVCSLGHVAYVEAVYSGSYQVSEMRYCSWECARDTTRTTGAHGESFIYSALPNLSIINEVFAPFTPNQGDLLLFYYMINNPNQNPVQNVRLGAQIRTSNPQGQWMDDPANDVIVTVTPGTGGTYCGGTTCYYVREFKTPQTITTGQYDVRFVILDNTTGQWFDSKESPYHITIIPTGARKTADLNGDGYVNMVDASIMMHYWGDTSKPIADINQDGYVNVQDVSIMMSNWYNP